MLVVLLNHYSVCLMLILYQALLSKQNPFNHQNLEDRQNINFFIVFLFINLQDKVEYLLHEQF
jgi:hypothetical protein